MTLSFEQLHRRTSVSACALMVLAVLLTSTSPIVSAPMLIPTLITIANPTPHAAAAYGNTVAGLNDVNGDGVPDLVVGAPGADRVQILSGADRNVIRTITDPDGLTGNQFGFAVANLGDVNGDGVDDIAVGAPGVFGIAPLPCVIAPCPPPDPALGLGWVLGFWPLDCLVL